MNSLRLLILLFFSLFVTQVFAEGSRDLTPGTAGGPNNGVNDQVGYLQHDDGANSGDFLRPGASDPYRMYIRILPGETVYYGVRRITTNAGGNHDDLILTLYENDGTVAQTTTLARDNGSAQQATLQPAAGVIGTRAECNAGPSAIVGATGYNALSYTNTTGTAQDFYVSFDQVNYGSLGGKQKSWYDLWDFSVYDGTEYKTGRLHSQNWSFTAAAGNALLSTEFVLYPLIPSNLGGYYVKSVDLGGIRPFGFFINANSEGTTTGANIEERRQSKNNNDAYPEYALYVNNPDVDVYPTTVVPQVELRQEYSYCAPSGDRGNLTVIYETNSPGIASVLVDLDGTPGFQPNTADTMLTEEVPTPGTYEITWKGVDGNGSIVPSGTSIEFMIQFQSAPLHVPMWDVEYNQFGGLAIRDVRPNLSQDRIFWDDREVFTNTGDFPNPVMLTGTNSILHQWLNNVGNNRLLNTWSFGYITQRLQSITHRYFCDYDEDLVQDFTDIDDDNDGILDVNEGPTDYRADEDGDNVPNWIDPDFADLSNAGVDPFVDLDENGIHDAFDIDGDGVVNARDLDSDNDGIPDAVEANDGTLPANMTIIGQYPAAYAIANDADAPQRDGLVADFDIDDTVEESDVLNESSISNPDSDGDGIPDFLDLDSDNDGITDLIELGETADAASGRISGFTDANTNGLHDPLETTALTTADTDGDGNLDHLDIDADNDGITDNYEGQASVGHIVPTGTDTERDGLDDAYDPDQTGGVLIVPIDIDGDLVPDFQDTDTDNDGVPDLIEGNDANADGFNDLDSDNDLTAAADPLATFYNEETGANADTDGDGLLDIFDTQPTITASDNAIGSNVARQNTDLADEPNWRDINDDNDAILTINEDTDDGTSVVGSGSGVGPDGIWANDFIQTGQTSTARPDYLFRGDADGDGIADIIDLDSDNDGILDTDENGGGSNPDPSQDDDGDGIPNYQDPDIAGFVDNNGDGVNDTYDFDGDGIPDFLDIDSDNDGIVDAVEANGGVIPPAGFDLNLGRYTLDDPDSDGLMNAVDDIPGAIGGNSLVTAPNTDGTGRNDVYDIDADDDGIRDNIEAQSTAGYIAPLGVDSEGDGLDDAYDGDVMSPGSPITPENTDGTDRVDYRDLDTDNDNVPDLIEGNDANWDGLQDFDGGTIYTASGNPITAFYSDDAGANTDGDGDGLLDIFDPDNGGAFVATQNLDGDAFPDWRDTDDDNDGIPTSGEDDDGDGDYEDDFAEGGTPRPDYLFRGDTDGDGIPDIVDLDDDNDGILDVDEDGGTGFVASDDADGDGIPNYLDDNDLTAGFPPFVDNNGDGVNDVYDTDGDGIPDVYDLDSDNDGIVDAVEANNGIVPAGPGFDVTTGAYRCCVAGDDDDGDGIMDPVDSDDAVVGGPSTVDNPDTDGDGVRDAYDLDADNDGVPDVSESGNGALDANGDGRIDNTTDVNGNGLFDVADPALGGTFVTPPNADVNDPAGETIPNHLDRDSDNDGISDVNEAGGTDTDSDGVIDGFSDVDGDGLADAVDPTHDGPDAAVNPNPGAGTPLPDPDVDGDGIRNAEDLDSDNDGLTDILEAGGAARDTDGDGRADGFTDSDGDGYNNIIESNPLPTPDSDGDGFTDGYDLDSDNDGIVDGIEAATGAPGGQFPPAHPDGDGDGLVNDVDPRDDGPITGSGFTTGTPATPIDSDGDGYFNHIDVDADDDGIRDNIEAQTTPGYLPPSGTDSNNNGLDAQYDPAEGGTLIIPVNFDGADQPDYLDLDTDNDGFNDIIEGHDPDDFAVPSTTPAGADENSNGLDDGFDGAQGGTEAPLQDGDSDGMPDWRDTDILFPIELLSFDAEAIGVDAELTWRVTAERNFSHYEIERRRADETAFAKVGQQAGNAHKEEVMQYRFTDAAVGQDFDGVVYYRLRNVDLDGSYDYSNVVAVQFGSGGNGVFSLSAYPNPTDGQLTLVASEDIQTMQVYSLTGQLQLTVEHTSALNLSTLSDGVYIVKVTTAQATQTLRIIKR